MLAKDTQGLSSMFYFTLFRIEIMQMDITKGDQITDAATNVASKFPHLDLLVNCAGMLHPSGKGETSLKDLDQQVCF